MKKVLLCWLGLAVSVLAEGEKCPLLTTIKGREYYDVVVTGSDPDALKIKHAYGVATIPFKELSPEIQKRFGYDPEAGAKYAELQEKMRKANEAIEDAQPWASYARAAQDSSKPYERRTEMAKQLPYLRQICSKLIDDAGTNKEAMRAQTKKWCDLAASEKIQKGMPEVFIYLSWGLPRNTSTFSSGMIILHYGTITQSRTLTLINGFLESWSSYE